MSANLTAEAESRNSASYMVWFDFGGVLSPPLDNLFDAYGRKTGITAAQLQQALRDASAVLGGNALSALELGEITEAEFGRLLRGVLTGVDLSAARLETFGAQWFEGVQANPLMIRTARSLRALGHRIGVLSNNVVEWEPYWRPMISEIGEPDCVIDSCRVGCRKPDPRIFAIAERTAGVRPGNCVLIDDLAENCTAAVAAGWQAVHFRTDQQTITDLSQLLGHNELLAAIPATPAPVTRL